MKTAKRLVVFLLLVVIISSMVPFTASANGTIAWGAANVNGNSVRIRSGPGLDHPVLTNAVRGEVVIVIERTSDEWHKVNFHGTIGYMSVPFLENRREAANFNARGSISGSSVNMRERPDTSSSSLGLHPSGTVMDIIGINKGWYKVVHNNVTGYVRSDLMSVLSRDSSSSSSSSSSPDATAAPDAAAAPADATPAPAPIVSSLGQQIADTGVGLVGHGYRWAGSSPSTGFDCSGFVSYVLRQHGISVTRSSAGMFRDNGVSISRSELAPGDLVFFARNGYAIDHVGIYIGDGRYVHSSTAQTGVIISSLGSRTLFGAKRVV